MHIYPLLLDFLPIEVTRAQSRVPCAIQQVLISYLFYIVQSPSHVWLFVTPQTAARQASLSLTIGVCPSSHPLNQWCHPTISSSVTLFAFCLQSFPASGSFPSYIPTMPVIFQVLKHFMLIFTAADLSLPFPLPEIIIHNSWIADSWLSFRAQFKGTFLREVMLII